MTTTDKDNLPLPEPGFTWRWENDEWMLRPNPVEVTVVSPSPSVLETMTAEFGIDIYEDFQAWDKLDDHGDFERRFNDGPGAKMGCRIVRMSEAEIKVERPKRQAQMLAEEIMLGADDGKSLIPRDHV